MPGPAYETVGVSVIVGTGVSVGKGVLVGSGVLVGIGVWVGGGVSGVGLAASAPDWMLAPWSSAVIVGSISDGVGWLVCRISMIAVRVKSGVDVGITAGGCAP